MYATELFSTTVNDAGLACHQQTNLHTEIRYIKNRIKLFLTTMETIIVFRLKIGHLQNSSMQA